MFGKLWVELPTKIKVAWVLNVAINLVIVGLIIAALVKYVRN